MSENMKRRRVKNTAKKGRSREWRSMAFLSGQGFTCIRSAASKGVFDFVAISRHEVYLVQVKVNRWESATDRKEMEDFPAPDNVTKLVHRWDDRKRPLRVKVLIDGQWEESLITAIPDDVASIN